MVLEGRVYKDGKFWLIEIPGLDALTQGHTRLEAIDMMSDYLESLFDSKAFKHRLILRDASEKFFVETSPSSLVAAMVLKRQREKSGLSVRDVIRILGYKSTNSYTAYENGRREPSIGKMEELLRAVSKQDHIKLKLG